MILNTQPSDMPQPLAPLGAPRDLEALRALLAQGWQIEPPVLARLSWAQGRTGGLSYHVILTRAAQRSLVVIPDHRELQRFLAELNIPIV